MPIPPLPDFPGRPEAEIGRDVLWVTGIKLVDSILGHSLLARHRKRGRPRLPLVSTAKVFSRPPG